MAQTKQRARLTFYPLTPEGWGDLEKLFGERGACGGCWCMSWRLKRSQFDKQKGALNKAAFSKIVATGRARSARLLRRGADRLVRRGAQGSP